MSPSKRADTVILALCLAMGVMTRLSTDHFLPSLPAIQQGLNIHSGLVQLTISFYPLCIGLSHIAFGPLADHIGRKKTLVIGYILALTGCLISMQAPKISWLIIGRCIQGIGIGVNLVCCRAILRDVFDGQRLAKASTYFGILVSIVPPLAPITGGYIQSHTHNWRYNFLFLASLIALLFINVLCFLPETLKKEVSELSVWQRTLTNARNILTNRTFCFSSITTGLNLASILTFVTMSVFLFQTVLGMSPKHFGLLSLATAGSMIIGGLINGKLLDQFTPVTIIGFGSRLLLLSALGVLIPGLLGFTSILIVMIPICLCFVATGLLFTNGFTTAMNPFPSMAGTASALLGLVQGLTATLFVTIAALLPEHNQVPMGCLMAFTAAVQLLNVRLLSPHDN